ncbi:unnamed protein product [Orchesella dallaii]|uniref:Cap-specific mRNA (nucleoside-2'-O-)-methyltransferase 2 n=1 Tax=Orchesella dallaii TaxID=48710 RepID=A0ABP1R9E3_9HEXA
MSMSTQRKMVKVKCRVSLDYLKPATKIKKPDEDAVDGEGACQVIIPTEERVVDPNPVTQGVNEMIPEPEPTLSVEPVMKIDPAVESATASSISEPEPTLSVEPIMKIDPVLESASKRCAISEPEPNLSVKPVMKIDPAVESASKKCLISEPETLDCQQTSTVSPTSSGIPNKFSRKLKCRISFEDLGMVSKKPKTEMKEDILVVGNQAPSNELLSPSNTVHIQQGCSIISEDQSPVSPSSLSEEEPTKMETLGKIVEIEEENSGPSDLGQVPLSFRVSEYNVNEAPEETENSSRIFYSPERKRKCRISLQTLGPFVSKPKTEPEEDSVDGSQVSFEERLLAINETVKILEENDTCSDTSSVLLSTLSASALVKINAMDKITEVEVEEEPENCSDVSKIQLPSEVLMMESVGKNIETENGNDFSPHEPGNLITSMDLNEQISKEVEAPMASNAGRPKLTRGWISHIHHLVTRSKNDLEAETAAVCSKEVTTEIRPVEENVDEGDLEVLHPPVPMPLVKSIVKEPEWRSEMVPVPTPHIEVSRPVLGKITLDNLNLLLKSSITEEPKTNNINVSQAATEVITLSMDDSVVNAEEFSGSCNVTLEPVPSEFAEPESVIETSAEETEMFPEMPSNPHWIKPEILLREMWNKKTFLRSQSDDASMFILPDDDTILNAPALQIPELMVLKGRLNETKSQLDHFPLQEWHSHTKHMNIANKIMPNVKRIANPEFSSQAWGKMFEILCSYDIIPVDIINKADQIYNEEGSGKVAFDSIHLCEAPGAFVSAFNHFLKISYPAIDWNWMATTLSPYHESNDVSKMINDDRLILMSMDNWTFLEDFTGNILSYPNLKYIVKERQYKLLEPRKEVSGNEPETVLLVTADGSIDCQGNPSDQEKMVAHLHFGEIVTALMLLHKGGTFVLKIFTFLEASTICHLYFLSCVFEELHLFKPSVSKEGNSEVYVICLKYLGKDTIRQVLHKKLVRAIGSYEEELAKGNILFPLQSIPAFFIERVKDAAHLFCNYQMKIIMRNISCFPCDTRVYEIMMKPAQKLAADQWAEMTSVEPLPVTDRLFNDEKMKKALHVDVKEEQGCFADKVQRRNGNDLMKLAYIKADLMAYKVWKTPQTKTLFGGKFLIGNVKFEKSYQNIRSSRFCPGRLLTDREQVREICKRYMKELEFNGLKTLENICMGHSLKRVYKSMAKSCDVMLRDLEVMCFIKMTWDFVSKTDFEVQRNDLKRLLLGVKDLKKGHSMFLCRFPLLSRLQTGIIYCLTAVFEKVIIYADPEKNVVGIMLHQYKGLAQPENKKLFHSIDDIMSALEEDEFDRPVLEMVPVKTLIDFFPGEFLLNYNILLITQDMLRTVSVLDGIVLRMLPVADQLTSFYTA